jgi:hypothetical protein
VIAECHSCGSGFRAQRRTARYCSSTCRSRARRARTSTPMDWDSDIVHTTRGILADAGALNTFEGLLALELAARVGAEKGRGLARLSRELRATLSEALGGGKNVSDRGAASLLVVSQGDPGLNPERPDDRHQQARRSYPPELQAPRGGGARMSVRCEQCGVHFEARRSTARFCSGACRQRAHRVSIKSPGRLASRELEQPARCVWPPPPTAERPWETRRVPSRQTGRREAIVVRDVELWGRTVLIDEAHDVWCDCCWRFIPVEQLGRVDNVHRVGLPNRAAGRTLPIGDDDEPPARRDQIGEF